MILRWFLPRMYKMYKLKHIPRALRLPFLLASILPFIFGSLIEREDFNLWGFILGLSAVISTHLSANLINDYADSKSGVDWQDKCFYNFFGGSKLIQEKVFSEKFYFRLASFFAILSCILVGLLAITLRSISVIGYYLAIIFFSWSYSGGPLRFSYRRLGEVFIFLLFGPALVMGGYFIQTGIFPDKPSFILSLPFGLLTANILFANEVPDFTDDKKAGKLTWVSLTQAKNAFVLYFLLMALAFFSIFISIILKYIGPWSMVSFVFMIPVFKATKILKSYYAEKDKLIDSSKLTILVQTLVSIVLIFSLLL
jgi:1,4-dihydroxy-2-naphthoate octaprenyltransferase